MRLPNGLSARLLSLPSCGCGALGGRRGDGSLVLCLSSVSASSVSVASLSSGLKLSDINDLERAAGGGATASVDGSNDNTPFHFCYNCFKAILIH